MLSSAYYINRCIELAQNGLGMTYPNPMVGSVLVYNERIIGEGWHQKSGSPHAEVNAINSVKPSDQGLIPHSTLYVNLEPCSHLGKTPPCADYIIAHRIKKVVIGSIDPFAKVCGNGIAKLKEAGVVVEVGVQEAACEVLNRRFFTYHRKNRPYILLKWAETQDGFIAPQNKEVLRPVWISNSYSRQIVHKWRAQEQAVLVGTHTVLQDNPKLDVRHWKGQNPIRVVLDRSLRIPKTASVYDKSTKTIILTKREAVSDHPNLIYETIDFERMPHQIAEVLYKYGIQSLIVEGGTQVLNAFLSENLWDEARVFRSDSCLMNGVKAPDFKQISLTTTQILNDTLMCYRNV